MKREQAFFLACLVTVFTFGIVLLFQNNYPSHGNDLFFPLCGAQAIYRGADPYGGDCRILWMGREYPPNPMTTIWAALPFGWLGVHLGGIVMWSVINGLLFYGIFRTRRFHLLWMLLSPVYLLDINYLQWAPLITAAALTPELIPLSLAKPHTAIPVILTNLTRRRVLILAGVCLATLIFDFTWPIRWLSQTVSYDGFIPLVVFPLGPLALLALLRWREKKPWFFLLFALSPQRGFYDQLPLWTVTERHWQALVLSICSWIGFLLSLNGVFSFSYEHYVIAFLYLPTLVLILIQKRQPQNIAKTPEVVPVL